MVSSSCPCPSQHNHNHNTGISNKRRLKANARSASITSSTSNKNNSITLLRNKDSVYDAVAYHPIETSKIETALISYASNSNNNNNNNNHNNESLLDKMLLDSREDDDETYTNNDMDVNRINNSYDYDGDNKAIIDIVCDSWINQCCCSSVISNQTLSPASYKIINTNNKHKSNHTNITNDITLNNNEHYNEFLLNNAIRKEEARDSTATINVSTASLPKIMKLNKFELHIENFKKLHWKGRICTQCISTYQGRIPESSNGCTVIAPLLAVQHFFFSNNNNKNNDNHNNMIELSNAIIEEVIDIQAPIVLPEVRNMLGLPKDALIVPSDVHDYFLENGLLSQENFLGVCGGNILNPMHLDSLIQLLDNSNTSTCRGRGRGRATKLAATFYFHEHVISILCYPDYNDHGNDNALLGYYEVIDSLPYYNDVINEECNITPANALRIKCYDKEALKITLLWYSIRKFTDDNINYVQMYEWNEMNTDLDPRVFQAFVWISL